MTTKIWKSFPEQLGVLKQRGLCIHNEARALNYLARLGYYRLSGYWYSFREMDLERSFANQKAIRADNFQAETYFEDIISLYVFDKRLRLLALDALERIEMALRTDIAHLLGEKDPFAHEKADCLHRNFSTKRMKKGKDQGKTLHEIWLHKYAELLRRSSKLPFVEHYLTHHGKLPIWVAIEIWDFGLLSRLFSGMSYNDKKKIAQKYDTNGETLGKWLKSLNFIRNISAHHSRLWNSNILELSPATHEWKECINHRPFMYFCVMQHLMNKICPNSKWGERCIALLDEFPTPKNKAVTLKDFGIVDNWKEWELWQK